MAKIRQHLARAPITEALIDLQIGPAAGAGLESVKSITEALKGRYDLQGPIHEIETQWSVPTQGDPQSTSASRELGVRLHSADGKYVLQARTNGLTLSRLEPYEDWSRLLTETQALWKTYADLVRAETITRVATRFINNLRLPMKLGEIFDAYLTKSPQVPDELPQGVLGFMQRVVLLKPELDLRANVIQLLQEGVAPRDHVPVILDIDVYKRVSMPADSSEIWPLLGELRSFKNAIFFASLTEAAVSMFE